MEVQPSAGHDLAERVNDSAVGGLANGLADNLEFIRQDLLLLTTNNVFVAPSIYGALVELVPDATLLVDERGAILSLNRHAKQMFGYSAEELIGQPVELIVPDHAYVWSRTRHEVIAEATDGGAQQGAGQVMNEPTSTASPATAAEDHALVGRRKDGAEFPADIMLRPLLDGGSAQVITVIHDLSERVREHERTQAAISEMQHRLLDCEENERQRLAQELHDGPLQELHCLDFKLVAMARLNEDERQQAELMEMRSSLRQLARHLRAICQDLRPPALTPFGVAVVLRSFAETFQQDHPELSVELDLEDDGQRLEERTRLTLYRICQHSLRNVAQHAEAGHVYIGLHLGADCVELRIEDDGRGFVLPEDWLTLVRAGKFGLLGCIERAEAIGGQLTIRTEPGHGVQLLVTAPLGRNGSTARPANSQPTLAQ